MDKSIVSQSAVAAHEPDVVSPFITIGDISVAVGELCLTNDELAERFGTTPEAIFRKIGIESRCLVAPDVTPIDLALRAVEELIVNPAFDPADISMIIVASSSIAQVCPSVACEVLAHIQKRRPSAPDIMAFDILATCTGWLYGLTLACDHLNYGPFRKKGVLLLTTEVFSQGIARDDFGAQVSFGDAATATVVWGPEAQPSAVLGKGYLHMKRPHCFARADNEGALWGPPLNIDAKLKMDGHGLRQAVLPAMAQGLRVALADAGLGVGDLGLIVAHQSNQRVLNDLAAEMGVAANVMASNLRFRGNTSSSALPLLLHDLRQAGTDSNAYPTLLKPGSDIGFTAFGGGFTYGGAVAKVL